MNFLQSKRFNWIFN